MKKNRLDTRAKTHFWSRPWFYFVDSSGEYTNSKLYERLAIGLLSYASLAYILFVFTSSRAEIFLFFTMALALAVFLTIHHVYAKDLEDHIDFLRIEVERIKWETEETIRTWARENGLNEDWEIMRFREEFEKELGPDPDGE